MSIVKWDPWKELNELRSQTDELWNTFLSKLSDTSEATQSVAFLPDVDVVETAHDFRVYFSVPGIIEDDLEIEATATTLTVRGELTRLTISTAITCVSGDTVSSNGCSHCERPSTWIV